VRPPRAPSEEPVATPRRVSLAATLLARASAAITKPPASEPKAPTTEPKAPVSEPKPAAAVAEATRPAPPPPIPVLPTAEAPVSKPAAVPTEGPAPAPAALPETIPLPPPPPSPPPPPWRVPTWLTAPVLDLAIPDSPLGWGSQAAAAAWPSPAIAGFESEPATVGFAEPEAVTTAPSTPPVDAAAPPIETSPAQPVETVAEPTPEPDTAAPKAAESIAAAPEAPAESIATTPEPAAESITAAPEPAGDEPSPMETLAAALRRSVAAGPPPSPEPGSTAAAMRPLPRSAGEVRPSGTQLRAQRPLGAPQAAVRAPLAPGVASAIPVEPGLPAAEPPPVLIEPQVNPVAVSETAATPRPEERAVDRSPMRNRRLYRRVSIEAEFTIDGAPSQLLDLSMGGFAAAKAPPLAPDMVVPVTLRLSIDGVDISTPMRARMVYCSELRCGGRFIDLTASQTALLRYIVTWHGQSLGALGTTTLLDAITRWPEHGLPSAPALPPFEPERRTPWWSRVIGWWRARGSGDQ
jgi:hypothetical protein